MNFDEIVETLIKSASLNDDFINVDEILGYYKRGSLEFEQIKKNLVANNINIIDVYEISNNKKSNINETNAIKLYLNDIANIPLLSKEEEIELFKIYENARLLVNQNGEIDRDNKIIIDGKKAKEKLIISNLKLVVSIAKKFQNQGLDFLDLIQEGSAGLIKAIEKFEYEKGYRLSTYATTWILQSINRALDNKSSTIRKPVYVCENIKKFSNAKRILSQKLSREPSLKEVAAELGISDEEAYEIEQNMQEPLSLSSKCSFDENTTLEDFVSDDESTSPLKFTFYKSLSQDIFKILNNFPKKERDIIILRYGLDENKKHTLDEVATLMNTSKESVRQIQANVLNKIKINYPELYSYWLEL